MGPSSYNAMRYMSRRGRRVREPGPAYPQKEPALISAAIDLLVQNGTSFEELVASAQLVAAAEMRTRLGLNQAKLRVAV